MNLLKKVMLVICIVLVATNAFSEDNPNKVYEVPFEGPALQQIDSLQASEESYQKILAELEQIKSSKPDSENQTVRILIFPKYPTDSASSYDLLISAMKDMPEGSNNRFEYFASYKMISTEVNQAGLEYLYSLGTLDLSLDKVVFFD